MLSRTPPIASPHRRPRLVFLTAFALASTLSASPGAPAAVDEAWPRQFPSVGGTVLTMYQPQLDSWDGRSLQAHAAVSVHLGGASESTFGVLWISARTNVDKESRLVDFEQIELSKATFPSAPASESAYLDLFRQAMSKGSKPIALDRLEASMAILQEKRKGAALALRKVPHRILFSSRPMILVAIDGPPA